MLTDKKISIIVVCYNDAGSIKEMYRRVRAVMKEITPNFEIIYVNDRSPDNSLDILKEMAAQDKRLVVITHSRNFGSQAAYTTGMKYATGDAAILLDGDLQDPPELFPELVKKWLQGHDIVYGIRVRREGGVMRGALYKIFYRILRKLSYIEIPLDAGDFSLIDARVLQVINGFTEVNRYIRGLRAYVGFRTVGISYTRQERFSGVSNMRFVELVRWAKKIIFSFSYEPLEWISYLAASVTLLAGIGIVAYVALVYTRGAPSGFLTLMVAILFLGAIQLLSLAVIAEYLGRIFEEVKRRPVGIIDGIINDYKGKIDK